MRNLSFAYSAQPIFEKFSWKTSHRLNLVQGPSGCGKTTLLRILSGQIIAKADLMVTPNRSGLILQEDALFPWLTARQNFELLPSRLRSEEIDADVMPLRELVEPYFDRLASGLSFGQRRVLELYRILSGNFRLVLLDEPLNFLDTTRRKIVMTCISALASKGTMFVISTHYFGDFDKVGFTAYRFSSDMPNQKLQLAGRL